MPVLEIAILNVIRGREGDFESAFERAQAIISSMPGYIAHELSRCVEDASRYALLVQWTTLEAHTQGFRGSPQYQQWKMLLHDFYDPFPIVEHFERIETCSA
jgi:heme-degrading monooxygenase HmoA